MHGRDDTRPLLFVQLHLLAHSRRIDETECPILNVEPHSRTFFTLLLYGNRQRLLARRIDGRRKCGKTLRNRLPEILSLRCDDGLFASIRSRSHPELTQNLLRVMIEIFVDVLPCCPLIENALPVYGGKSILLLLAGRSRRIFFPKDEQIGNNARARSGKRRFGKTQCSDKTRLIGEHTTYTLVILVHCPLGGNGDHKTAGTHLIDHLIQKVIVNAQPLPQIFRIACDDLIAERYVADRKIK